MVIRTQATHFKLLSQVPDPFKIGLTHTLPFPLKWGAFADEEIDRLTSRIRQMDVAHHAEMQARLQQMNDESDAFQRSDGDFQERITIFAKRSRISDNQLLAPRDHSDDTILYSTP